MKLNLDSKEKVNGVLEVDFYTPINVRFNENDKRPRELLFYRWINKKSSLIEFSINSNLGTLVEITLVSINDITTSRQQLKNNVLECNPIFDLSLYEGKKILTDEVDFLITKEQDGIIILKNEKAVIKTTVKMDCASFFLDENNELVGIKFEVTSDADWAEINDAILQIYN